HCHFLRSRTGAPGVFHPYRWGCGAAGTMSCVSIKRALLALGGGDRWVRWRGGSVRRTRKKAESQIRKVGRAHEKPPRYANTGPGHASNSPLKHRLAPAYRAAAVERARQLAPVLAEMKNAGFSARRMAAALTARDVPTPNGGKWHAQTVRRMID